MLLPAQYAWFQPVLIASIVVFIIDLLGDWIAFGNRYLNALVSAVLFALVFGALVYFGYGSVSMSVTTTPSPTAPAQTSESANDDFTWSITPELRQPDHRPYFGLPQTPSIIRAGYATEGPWPPRT